MTTTPHAPEFVVVMACSGCELKGEHLVLVVRYSTEVVVSGHVAPSGQVEWGRRVGGDDVHDSAGARAVNRRAQT